MIEKILPYKAVLKRLLPAPVRRAIKSWLGWRRMETLIRQRRPRGDLEWGVNMIGAVNGASGLSEGSRGTALGLREAGIPTRVWDFEAAKGAEAAKEPPYRVNLVHANPNQLPELVYRIPAELWTGCYNIGFWVWEQEQLPEEWVRYMPLFDEIWMPSGFSAAAIRRGGTLPVHVVPHIVAPEYDPAWDRKRWGLPEDLFLVLVAFDCDSCVERKNPAGAVRAFCRAFSPEEPVGLVVKARNMTRELEVEFRSLLEGRENVYFFREDYPKTAVNSLIRAADVYLSLHRAEGFGLILAEAMYLGTPVVATDWSGNRDFMDAETACAVDARLVPLEQDIPPYKRGSRWAQPDEQQAAQYLRRLYEEPALRQRLTERAKARVSGELSAETVSQIIKERMEDLRARLG